MAEDQDKDSSQRTEEPTQRKIEEAIKKGHVAFSKEIVNFLFLLFLTLGIIWLFPLVSKHLALRISFYIEELSAFDFSNQADMAKLAKRVVADVLLFCALPLVINLVATLFGSLIQNGMLFSPEAILPKLEKINPLNGLTRLFSKKNLFEFIKGLIKISVVFYVAYLVFMSELLHIIGSANEGIYTSLYLFAKIAAKILIAVCIAMAFIAAIDYLIEKLIYMKSLMMTREELKEELKQSEGNPEIKGRQRRLMRERAQRRMISLVPKATIIITNPTHYSIALQYDPKMMPAPKILLKGVDETALIIRKLAQKHMIPIIENPPLARALYSAAKEDDFIPIDFYKAVAEILGKVLLKGKKRTTL